MISWSMPWASHRSTPTCWALIGHHFLLWKSTRSGAQVLPIRFLRWHQFFGTAMPWEMLPLPSLSGCKTKVGRLVAPHWLEQLVIDGYIFVGTNYLKQATWNKSQLVITGWFSITAIINLLVGPTLNWFGCCYFQFATNAQDGVSPIAEDYADVTIVFTDPWLHSKSFF